MNTLSKHPKPTIGVVIPAYNEVGNLQGVLTAVCAADWLTQIVVVNDGSTDSTLSLAKTYAKHDERMQVLHLPVNRGKAGAMLAGVKVLQTDIVIFLDADLLNLQPHHIHSLQDPVLAGTSDMTLSVFRHGRWRTDFSHRLTPNLSGQRCLWRDAAEQALLPLAETRYGVEVALTQYAHRHRWRVQRVFWAGVTHRTKEEKRKGRSGLSARWQMYRDIAAVLIPQEKKAPFWAFIAHRRNTMLPAKTLRIGN